MTRDSRFSRAAQRPLAGRDVHVLKTARLRGVYSQGIVFSLTDFPGLSGVDDGPVSTLLLASKWEPPLPPGMAVLGPFPSHPQKTDAERVQNLDDETWSAIQNRRSSWLPTEKVDGVADCVAHCRRHPARRRPQLGTPATASVYWDAIATSRLDESVGVGGGAGRSRRSRCANALKLDALRVVAFRVWDFRRR